MSNFELSQLYSNVNGTVMVTGQNKKNVRNNFNLKINWNLNCHLSNNDQKFWQLFLLKISQTKYYSG